MKPDTETVDFEKLIETPRNLKALLRGRTIS